MQNNSEKPKIELKRRAYIFALEIIKFMDKLDKRDFAAQVIAKQLLRSSTSIGANIVEAQAGSTKRDFTNFFAHALKSANETKFWLELLRDSGKAEKAATDRLLNEAGQLANILGSSILTLKGRKQF